MKMTDTYDVYCDKCGHLTAVLSHTCEEELTSLLEENERLNERCKALKSLAKIYWSAIEGLSTKIPRPEGE
jgi:hypothetical protein